MFMKPARSSMGTTEGIGGERRLSGGTILRNRSGKSGQWSVQGQGAGGIYKPAMPVMALFTVLVPKKAPGVEPKCNRSASVGACAASAQDHS